MTDSLILTATPRRAGPRFAIRATVEEPAPEAVLPPAVPLRPLRPHCPGWKHPGCCPEHPYLFGDSWWNPVDPVWRLCYSGCGTPILSPYVAECVPCGTAVTARLASHVNGEDVRRHARFLERVGADYRSPGDRWREIVESRGQVWAERYG